MHLIKLKGLTLVELLVALAIDSLLFIVIVSVFYHNMTHYNNELASDRLNQQLQGALQLMSTDIQRAGYWGLGNTMVGAITNINPFMSVLLGTDINTTGSCILYTYDKNGDGLLPLVSSLYDDERYGFRLNGQTLQSRQPGASFSCAAAASAWENVTNPNIVSITNLGFTINSTTIPSGSISLVMRSVDITITGQLVANSSITKTLTQHIKVQNDKFTPP